MISLKYEVGSKLAYLYFTSFLIFPSVGVIYNFCKSYRSLIVYTFSIMHLVCDHFYLNLRPLLGLNFWFLHLVWNHCLGLISPLAQYVTIDCT